MILRQFFLQVMISVGRYMYNIYQLQVLGDTSISNRFSERENTMCKSTAMTNDTNTSFALIIAHGNDFFFLHENNSFCEIWC